VAYEPDDAEILRRFGIEPDPVIEAYKVHIDRSLLRQNLMRTPEERWANLTAAQGLAEEVRRAGAEARPKDLEAVAELEALLAERERG
jgi:hypothetical protein